MELLSKADAAMRLEVTVDAVEAMIADGTLFAARFAAGIRVLLDDANDLARNDWDSPKLH